MPQMASSLTNLPGDLLAVFVGHEVDSDSVLFLYPQGLNCSPVHTAPAHSNLKGSTQLRNIMQVHSRSKNPKSTSESIHKD